MPLRQLTMRQVEAFRAVILLGSMTKAAELLQVSQPAVSRLIADMQETLGYTLFSRTRLGIVPTPEAKRLKAEVDTLFSGLDELNKRAFAIRDVQNGELRVGTISLYGNGFLPFVIAQFVKDNPGITVTLEIEQHDRIVDWVSAGKLELGLVSMPAFTGDLEVNRIAARPAVCIMPPGHRLALKPLIQPQDLEGEPFVSFLRTSATRFQVDRIFDQAGVRRYMAIETGTHEAVCNFVAAGAGVSIISPFSPRLKGADALISRPFHPTVMREFGLVAQPNQLSLAGAKFRRYVEARFMASEADGSAAEQLAAG